MVDHGVELVIGKDTDSILLKLLLDEHVRRLVVAIIKHRFLLVLLHDSHT